MPTLGHCRKPSLLVILLALLSLAGCGKKGSLYLPDSPNTPAHKQTKN